MPDVSVYTFYLLCICILYNSEWYSVVVSLGHSVQCNIYLVRKNPNENIENIQQQTKKNKIKNKKIWKNNIRNVFMMHNAPL